jgi:hypothetical protein
MDSSIVSIAAMADSLFIRNKEGNDFVPFCCFIYLRKCKVNTSFIPKPEKFMNSMISSAKPYISFLKMPILLPPH